MLSSSQENCNRIGSEHICHDVQIIKVGKVFPSVFMTGMTRLKYGHSQISKEQDLPEEKILNLNVLINIRLQTLRRVVLRLSIEL